MSSTTFEDLDHRIALTTLHFHEEVMGTVVTIDVFDESGVQPKKLWPHLEDARAELHRADRVFSTWLADSPLSRLRRGELSLVDAPEEMTEVLADCMVARALSGGWFDPWSMPGGVDPTGFVKGWAAQRALDAIAPAGVGGAVVNAAGDVATFGGPTSDSSFRIGIADPASPRKLAGVVELHGAIATSGTYERGAHLIDPHAGEAATCVASASVCGPDLGMVDALATALAVGGGDVLRRLEDLEGFEGLIIAFDGTMQATSAFPFARSERS